MNGEKLIISERQKPLLNRMITSFVFTLFTGYVFFSIGLFLNYFGIIYFKIEPVLRHLFLYLLVPVLASLPYVVSLTQVKQIQFDLEHNLYKERLVFGLIDFEKEWKSLPEIKYVSVFYQASDRDFEVLLWYDKNHYIKIFKGSKWAEIFYLGFRVAKVLGVDMFDTIYRSNKYWVDLEKPIDELLNDVS
jgi:hypothetical protein